MAQGEEKNLEDLPPEEQAQVLQQLRARQGASSLTAPQNLALQGSVMRDPSASVQHVPGEGLRAMMAGAQQNVANLPTRITEAMGAQPGGLLDLAGAGTSGILNAVTSQLGTPEGAALTAALGPVRAAGNLLPRWAWPKLAQTAGLTGVGALASGATGGDPYKGAGEGLTAGTMGAIFKSFSDRAMQKKNDALNFGKAIVQEVPWLKDLVPTTKATGGGEIGPLLAVRSALEDGGMQGQRLLSQRFEPVKEKIFAAIGPDTPIEVPALDTSSATRILKNLGNQTTGGRIDASTAQFVYEQAKKQGMFQSSSMTIGRAFDELLKAKALANNAPDGATGWTARERARSIQEQINALVQEHGGPELLAEYKDAMRQYGKGMAIIDLLNNDKTGIFKLSGSGGQLEIKKLQEYIANHLDEYGPKRFPALNQAATRGAPLGSGDTASQFRFPRFYGRGVSEGLPPVAFSHPVGMTGPGEMSKPFAGLTPALLSLIPPERALQQPQGSQTPLGE